MPRHKINPSIKKNKKDSSHVKKVRTVRITDDDYNTIVSKAKNAGLSFSEFMYISAINQKVTYKVDLMAINNLRRIGVNLNQISHQIKIKPELYQVKDILPVLTDIENLVSDLIYKIK